ncbi:thiamine pyrophosphate-requiring protein [Chryseosolibacter indicus]|uniref:Thiamine pyrophosphate-requiring protein n=1 Tax=Chryseosolibacter indicus TaxID=2782351 RepID=A0ABS5VRE7_9BACT|nr:thiamine pyrophosphate-requiring protein [Chryseosolibacter indicus]MBT1703424.1 thiamine pyrophosphate-requiring protein [Chryseosolibacter indicus]
MNVSDFLIKRLSSWGIKRIFGYPGDGINGIMGALSRAQEEIKFTQVRHEEMAALMACAYAKFTGEVGVCLATSGPGAIHLLNGLYDAKLDHQPVVAIIGHPARKAIGGNYQQEVDLISLFKDVAHEYVHMASDETQIRHLVDRAIRIAKAERTVTCVIIPNDIQTKEAVEVPPHEHYTIHTGVGHPSSIVIPTDEALQQAAHILNVGNRVAILVGAGAAKATEEVIQIAELLNAGVAKALLGKSVLADDLPFVTGSIGFFGTTATENLMNECDTLLMIGTSFPYAEFLPKEGQARAVQIDIDGRMLSLRYPVEVNLLGDSSETLKRLIPLIHKKPNNEWKHKIEDDVRKWRQEQEQLSTRKAELLNPQLVFKELSSRLPANCIITADSGSTASWYARELYFKDGMMGSLSGTLATMGCAVPYAIAAKFAYPEKTVIAFAGDGAMQMNGNEELLTISKYAQSWKNPNIIICVINNRDLNMVTWEQRMMEGDPKFEATQVTPEFNYAAYAESIGFTGIRIDSPEQVAEAWERALSANNPVLIEAITDPEISPFPDHVLMKKVDNLATSVSKGDDAVMKNTGHILQQKVEEKLQKVEAE